MCIHQHNYEVMGVSFSETITTYFLMCYFKMCSKVVVGMNMRTLVCMVLNQLPMMSFFILLGLAVYSHNVLTHQCCLVYSAYAYLAMGPRICTTIAIAQTLKLFSYWLPADFVADCTESAALLLSVMLSKHHCEYETTPFKDATHQSSLYLESFYETLSQN